MYCQVRKKSTKINFLGFGDCRVGWGSSRKGVVVAGGATARLESSLPPRKFVSFGSRATLISKLYYNVVRGKRSHRARNSEKFERATKIC